MALTGPVLLFFGLVEGGLRLAGVGHPSAFWHPGHLAGNAQAVDNPFFTRPVFGPRRARLATPFALDRPKKDGVTRIFVLGGSAVQGDPDPSFSTARFLEVLLPIAWPEARFEVVNAALTAIDSTVVRMVASDVMGLEPDVLVVYAGNNEIVGPFGPSAGGIGRRVVSNLRRGLLRFRFGQVLAHLADESALEGGTMEDWQGLEAFVGLEMEPSDERLVEVRARFADNIGAIVAMAEDAGIPIILCTVGVNLADSPPFGSGGGQGLNEAQRQAQDDLIDRALQAAAEGTIDSALARLDEAAQIGSAPVADIEFLRGRLLLASGRQDEALKAFALSRDVDRLRFRADSSTNTSIRESVRQANRDSVILADVERAMEEASSNGVPGREFFYEHVHLTPEGTSVVAREIIRAMAENMAAVPFAEQAPRNLPDDGAVARRLALTGWAQVRMGAEILDRIQRAPFTQQMGHQATLRTIERDLRMMGPWMGPEGLTKTRAILTEALERDPDDWFHSFNLALVLRQMGDDESAVRYLRSVLALRPTFSTARRELGRALIRTDRPEVAVTVFRRVLEVHPYSVEALTDLGVALVAAEMGAEAVRPLERALLLEPENVSALYHLALARASEGESGRGVAIGHLKRVLGLDPSHRDAATVLNALEGEGQ